LNPSHKNKRTQEYIIGKMILNMLNILIEQMILQLKDAKLINGFKAKRTIMEENHVMQAEKPFSRFFPIFNEEGTLEVIIEVVDVKTQEIQNEFPNRKLITSIL
jgi:hypothetical protein